MSINDYTIQRKLGSGGFADAFLAVDKDGKEYCIKILKGHDESVFKVELSAAKMRLAHLNIVKILGVGRKGNVKEGDKQIGERQFVITEFC